MHGSQFRRQANLPHPVVGVDCRDQEGRRAVRTLAQGCDVYVYFDNDQKSAAPADAQALREMV
ncbi:hypothetical protein ACVL91_003450 [Bradyrhizobium elkanii]|uniref:Uncharacterized protein n=1 Tax=Bradyrhizobium elkanii TaxID=29448 RepID=A0A8I2C428_BRAEL|nr:hypothetical protein [Bradyrhizobium elkanii]